MSQSENSLAQAAGDRVARDSETKMGRVLVIAGSDSGGGAGIQADIKAITMLGGFAATAITAVTVQNTLGVHGVHPMPLDVITAQARCVLEDIGTDAVKTGMLGTVDVVETVAALLDEAKAPAVVDPVMIAKGGHPLLPDLAVEAVKSLMVPRAALLTPNAPEAEALTGLSITDADGQRRAGEMLLGMGAKAVLMKGGHVDGDTVIDILMTPDGETVLESERVDTRRGSGFRKATAWSPATPTARAVPSPAPVRRAWQRGFRSISR